MYRLRLDLVGSLAIVEMAPKKQLTANQLKVIILQSLVLT